MKTINYHQCNLQQGNTNTVGWIEERGAKIGMNVEIDELGGFWTVTSVGETTKTKEEVKDAENRARRSFDSLKEKMI